MVSKLPSPGRSFASDRALVEMAKTMDLSAIDKKTGEALTMRLTLIGGETAPDDYQVFWDGLPIGRILKQPGVPVSRPNWHWGVAFPGRPQPSAHRGNCSDLDECKRRFKAIWAGIRTALTDVDVETARKIEAAVDRRLKKSPVRD